MVVPKGGLARWSLRPAPFASCCSTPLIQHRGHCSRRQVAHAITAAAQGGGDAASANPEAPLDPQGLVQLQAQTFSSPDIVDTFAAPLPADISKKLKAIVDVVPGLDQASRVIDVGTGTGVLIPFLQARGVRDILAVDVAAPMLERLRATFASSLGGALGNEPGVRTWQGDICDLPLHLGRADAVFFNSVLGNLHSPRMALLRAAQLLQPGGHVVVAHPMGRPWHVGLRAQNPALIPHTLPDRAGLESTLADLPLQLLSLTDAADMWCALLQVPPRLEFKGGRTYLSGEVVKGFGRGSRQLGTPTANIAPGPLAGTLQRLPRGVYFGWAQVRLGDGPDGQVHKMVMNVGRRPTVNTGDEAATVELHVMHTFEEDFYGCDIRAVVLGFIRPELRMPSLDALLQRIKADTATARVQLDDPVWAAARSDPIFHAPW